MRYITGILLLSAVLTVKLTDESKQSLWSDFIFKASCQFVSLSMHENVELRKLFFVQESEYTIL